MMERTLTGKKMVRSRENREEEIEKLANKRNRWEDKHLGNFEKVFPVKEESELSGLYK
jgi:hypothetical protein